MEHSIDLANTVGIALSFASFILAVVSIVFSALFFWWGKKENERAAELTATIKEKTNALEKLFDNMYKSTYDIIRENNRAMSNHIFSLGKTGDQEIVSNDMEVYLAIRASKRISKEDLSQRTKVSLADLDRIVKKVEQRGCIQVNGNIIELIDDNPVGISQSTDNLSNHS